MFFFSRDNIGFSFPVHQKCFVMLKYAKFPLQSGLRPWDRGAHDSPRNPSRLGRGHPLPISYHLDAFGVSFSVPRLPTPPIEQSWIMGMPLKVLDARRDGDERPYSRYRIKILWAVHWPWRTWENGDCLHHKTAEITLAGSLITNSSAIGKHWSTKYFIHEQKNTGHETGGYFQVDLPVDLIWNRLRSTWNFVVFTMLFTLIFPSQSVFSSLV